MINDNIIGIIVAMKIEANEIKNVLRINKTEIISGIEYFIGEIFNKKCIMAVCGPGKVNAAICAQTMAIRFSTSVILNCGVAGGVGSNRFPVKIGDIVISKDVIQNDIDTSAVGDEVGLISGINIVKIPCSQRLFNIAVTVKSDPEFKDIVFHFGTIMTSDKFISNKIELTDLHNKFGGIACEMESGSIGHVCYVNNIEFLSIRAVSDSANESAHTDYANYLEASAARATTVLLKIIKAL